MAIIGDPHRKLCNTRHLVRALGFTVGLDYDGELLIEQPATVSVERIVELLRLAKASLASEIEGERKWNQMIYVGGPMNGKRHAGGCSQWLTVHVGRARWAAYYRRPDWWRDGRAFYIGEATNKRKARLLAFNEGPKRYPKTASELD